MKIAWLADDPGYKGGAELSSEAYQRAAPDGYELVIRTHKEPCPEDCDAYIVGNCTAYDASVIKSIRGKPVIKIVFDLWRYGDSELRHWLLNQSARVILVSPPQLDWLPYTINVPISYVPCPVDIVIFERAANEILGWEGVCWLGRMWPGKGLANVIEWSKATGQPVDYYGSGPERALVGDRYRGEVRPEEVPALLARYATFIFLPDEFDPCPRTVIEAWAAGCRLILNGRVGVQWWLDNDPEALRNACTRFWQVVGNAIDGIGGEGL
jgi:glycosyltransferase involved in cell wall biosynthesis